MTTCAIILSGSGVYDGSEIHEATLTYYFLDKKNISVSFLAPDCDQTDVIDHYHQQPLQQKRNVLIESSRIARGQISPLSAADTNQYDMAIFPGGFGAAKTLSDFAESGKNLSVNNDVEQFCKAMHSNKKPLGFLCITPVIAAKLFPGVITTLGIDQSNLDTLSAIGAQSRQALEDDVVIDQTYNIYSTPAYMIETSISKIALGIEKLVDTMFSSLEKTNS